ERAGIVRRVIKLGEADPELRRQRAHIALLVERAHGDEGAVGAGAEPLGAQGRRGQIRSGRPAAHAVEFGKGGGGGGRPGHGRHAAGRGRSNVSGRPHVPLPGLQPGVDITRNSWIFNRREQVGCSGYFPPAIASCALKNRTITSVASAGGFARLVWKAMLSPGGKIDRSGRAVQV